MNIELTITIFLGILSNGREKKERKKEIKEWKKKGKGTYRRENKNWSKDEVMSDGNKEEKKESAKQSYIL